MNFPKLFNLKTAAHNSVPFNLSSRTITTGEFFQFTPVKCIECVPGDKFSIDMSVFARTAPLAVPSFDRAVIQSRAFFVPSRLAFPLFNEFITGEKVQTSINTTINPSCPVILSSVITEFFALGEIPSPNENVDYPLSKAVQSTDNYDFQFRDSQDNITYRQLTAEGRRILKIFNGLGYKWNWLGPYESQEANELVVTFSAMPLLAFFKIYLDWFVPSQLQASHPITAWLNIYKSSQTAQVVINHTALEQLFKSVRPAFDEDYFTSAWLYPNNVGGNSNLIDPSILNDYALVSGSSSYKDNISSDSNGTYLTNSTITSRIAQISQYGLNLLKGLADYVTRNNYAGTRAVEQILARFGIRVPDERLQRSEFLGKDDTDIQFMEVTSMADSGAYDLGQFAGKGVAFSKDGKFNVECKEYGYIIIVSTIVPKISYLQGFDRSTIHLQRFDFFTPEFDCVGPQAIASGELFCDGRDKQDHTFQDQQYGNNNPLSVFGYCPRYTEYKVGHDMLLGDFTVPHLNDGGALNAYHFGRMIYPTADMPAQAQGEFLFADGEQYNRIFNVTDSSADHFYMWYNFNIKAYRPMRSISDSIPLDGDGEKVAMQPNGIHMN